MTFVGLSSWPHVILLESRSIERNDYDKGYTTSSTTTSTVNRDHSHTTSVKITLDPKGTIFASATKLTVVLHMGTVTKNCCTALDYKIIIIFKTQTGLGPQALS